MAPALLLSLASAVLAASLGEVALSSATRTYKDALERYNAYVVLNGSVQDEEAVRLHAAKEAARREMLRAQQAAGTKAPAVLPADGPLAAPAAPAPVEQARSGPEPTAAVNRDIRLVRRGFVALAGLAGSGLLAWGAVGWWSRRPRTLKCPGCGRKLKVPGRGVKARCPKCTVVFDA